MTKKEKDAARARIERLCRFHKLDPEGYIHMSEENFIKRVLNPLVSKLPEAPASIWLLHPPSAEFERPPKVCPPAVSSFCCCTGKPPVDVDPEYYWVRYGTNMAARGCDFLPSEKFK